jgi:hypothetical protein
MGSKVQSVDAASYHIKDGFVTFKDGDDVPIASFATIHVTKVELEGAVTEAPNPSPPQAAAPAAGEWTTPGFGWERPVLPPEITPDISLPPVIQPVEAQSWERWTDVWQTSPDSAAPPAVSSPVLGEPLAGMGFDDASVSMPLPAPVEDRPPASPEEGQPLGPADAVADEWSIGRDANAQDSGEWWIVDNPPVPDADPHQWWIVDDSAEATTGTRAPAPGPEADAAGSETPHPTAGLEEEDAARRAGRRSRDRRERDSNHGWASSLASKRNRAAGSGSGSGDRSSSLSHQLRARRVWAMEEPEAAAGEAEVAPAASAQASDQASDQATAQEGGGNVVRLPVENHAGAVADDVAPEARAQENPVTAIASGGRAGPKAVGTERVPQRSAAAEAARAESVVTGAVAKAEVAADELDTREAVLERRAPRSSSQRARLEHPGPAEHKDPSPDAADLLEIAEVQAAVDAIVDAAVRGASTDPDDEFE